MIQKWTYTLFVALLFLVVACTSSKKVEPMHIHPNSEIEILGQKQVIPTNIGLSPNQHQPIHTHETDGTLHVESPIIRDFYLREFFQIWNKRFDEQCIFDYCTNATPQLRVYVNGVENHQFGGILLEDNQKIKITYGER